MLISIIHRVNRARALNLDSLLQRALNSSGAEKALGGGAGAVLGLGPSPRDLEPEREAGQVSRASPAHPRASWITFLKDLFILFCFIITHLKSIYRERRV